MYNEFRSLALDDFSAQCASNASNRLLRYLRCFFDELQGPLTILTLSGKGLRVRLTVWFLQTQRSAWQCISQRSRKKFDSVLDISLRAELEKLFYLFFSLSLCDDTFVLFLFLFHPSSILRFILFFFFISAFAYHVMTLHHL